MQTTEWNAGKVRRKIEIRNKREDGKDLSVESIMIFNLEEVIAEYDKKVFLSLQKREYNQCENYLSDFCFELLDLSEEEQVLIARTFFVSIVTDIMRVKYRKKLFQPRMLSYSYDVISKIEKWGNLSEYLLSISWFIEQLKENIIADQILFDGCSHVEKALKLINHHLEGKVLTVNWLASQLQISTTHLSNLFKLQLGETVSNFIMKRKMDEIIFELTYTNQSLKEIREKYGFVNHSHFIQYFKKYKGVTPLKYKQELHK